MARRLYKLKSRKSRVLLLCDVKRDRYCPIAHAQEPIELLHSYELLYKWQYLPSYSSSCFSFCVILVNYLKYGPFSSFSPSFDSSMATITKEDSDLLYSTYGDSMGAYYAQRYVSVDSRYYSIFMRFWNRFQVRLVPATQLTDLC